MPQFAQCVDLGSDRYGLMFTTCFCVVGWSDTTWKDHHKVRIWLESRSHLSWSRLTAKLVSAGTVGSWLEFLQFSNAAELQVTVDAEKEITYIRPYQTLEIFEGAAPLKNLQDVAEQVPATVVLDSRGVYNALARSESPCLGLRD